ncbi:MAG: site-2 protease family protein [Spirochaetales bacterium]
MFNILSTYSGSEAIIISIAFFIAILFSLALHEFGHAFVAYKQGDITAKSYGRLTINPFAHVDPMGMLMLIVFGFGWAKPVPVNPIKFKNYRKGIFLVSIAGISVNLILFILFTFIYALMMTQIIPLDLNTSLGLFVFVLVQLFAGINLSLAAFNLIPVAPLDGFNIMNVLFKKSNKYIEFVARYGQIILLVLLLSGLLTKYIELMYNVVFTPLLTLFINVLT